MSERETNVVTPTHVPTEPWTATALRSLVHGIVAVVATIPIAVPAGVLSAALGAAVGAVVGRAVSGSRLRVLGAAIGTLGACAVVVAVRSLLADGPSLAASVGPESAASIADAWSFGAGAFVFSALLRFASARRRTLAILEVVAIGLAFAQLVRAHRYGAINRPFEIADPILVRGGDPTIAIAILGGVALFVIALFLLSERSVLRSVFHVAVLMMLLLGGGTAVYLHGADDPFADDPLGLQGKGKNEKDQKDKKTDKSERPNDELEFRDNYDRPKNPPPIGVVLFHDEYSPPFGMYYFRQGAFSQFNGARLVQATRSDVDQDIADGFPTTTYRVKEAPLVGAYRSTVDTTVGLLADHTRPFGLEAPLVFSPEANPNPRRFRRMYRVTSAPIMTGYEELLGHDVGAPSWTEDERRHYTEAPSDPRYKELAERIVNEMLPDYLRADPVAQAIAVTAWLGQNGTYSLRSKHADAEDPTAHFLFGDLTGYCVHFAHAGVFLMRSIGIPTRVATGYAVPESNRQGGSGLVVTGADAHAWPEVYIDGFGWVVTDVSPAKVLSPAPPPPDPDLQRLLAELMRGEKPLADDAQAREDFGAVFRRWFDGAKRFLGGALAGALVFLVLAKIWRALVPLVASKRSRARVTYRAALDRLSELGRRRRIGETREAFARRLSGEFPHFVALTDAHLAEVFGEGAPSDPRPLLRAVVRERRALPFWRRALGTLSPWSWLRTR